MSETVSIRDIFIPELGKAVERKDGYVMSAKGQNPRTGYMDLSVTMANPA